MRRFIRYTPVFAALTLAACNRGPAMDEQMKADLQAASAGSIELAPAGAATKVVSGIEQIPRAQPRPTAPRPKAPPVEADRAESPDPAPTREPRVAQPARTSNEPAATRPSSTPRVSPPPPGGYKTVDEVIRNAPFPIKPATKKP